MKRKIGMLTIFVIVALCVPGVTFGNKANSRETKFRDQIQKKGLQNSIESALRKGEMSGREICSTAFKSKKKSPKEVAEILSRYGMPKMEIIREGVKAGCDVREIAEGIKRGSKERHRMPVCGNLGGEDPEDNPISRTKIGKRHRHREREGRRSCGSW